MENGNITEAFEAADSRSVWLGLLVPEGLKLFALAAGTSPDTKLDAKWSIPGSVTWTPGPHNVYFGVQNDEGRSIVRVNIESGAREEIYRFPSDVRPFNLSQTTLSVSHDERSIYYQYRKRLEQDILLVDRFQ
jgi:hypothetical protein